VARLERAWVEAYHAAEAETAADFSSTPPASLRLHPATRLVRSRFPILDIWQANQPDTEPRRLELTDAGENVLVTRPHAEVQACRVPDEAVALIETLAAGACVAAGEHLNRLCSVGAITISRRTE
jgi:hypothetical protein